jgi:hypothetical protein
VRGISWSGLLLDSTSLFSVWFDTWRSLVVPREQNDGTVASEGTIIGVWYYGTGGLYES